MKTWWEAISTEAPFPACSSFSGQRGGSTPPQSAGCTCAPRPRLPEAASTACAAIGQPSGRSSPSSAIKHFEHSVVVVGLCTVHEGLDLAQHTLDGGTFQSGLQPVVSEKLTACAFRLGNSIGGQDDAVAGLKLETLGGEAGLFDQANNHVGVFQPLDALAVSQQRLHMPAIDIFEGAVRVEFDQDHGCVFLYVFLADIAIGNVRDL